MANDCDTANTTEELSVLVAPIQLGVDSHRCCLIPWNTEKKTQRDWWPRDLGPASTYCILTLARVELAVVFSNLRSEIATWSRSSLVSFLFSRNATIAIFSLLAASSISLDAFCLGAVTCDELAL